MSQRRSRWQIYQSALSQERVIVGFVLALWLLAGGLLLRTFQKNTLSCQRIEPRLIDCNWHTSWNSLRGVPVQSLRRLRTTTIDSFEVSVGENPYVVHQLILIGQGGQAIEIPAMRSHRTANHHAESIDQFIENEAQSELRLIIRPYLNFPNLLLAVLPALLGLGFANLVLVAIRKELHRMAERSSR